VEGEEGEEKEGEEEKEVKEGDEQYLLPDELLSGEREGKVDALEGHPIDLTLPST